MLQNILFVKDDLSKNPLGSFNDKFHSSELPLNYITRSSSTTESKQLLRLKGYDPQINSEQNAHSSKRY